MIGTRSSFRAWLQAVHALTYTAYTKLPLEKRTALWEAYANCV